MNSQRPFAAFDIDGTLIRWQLYHAVATRLAAQNPIVLDKINRSLMQWKHRAHQEAFKEYELRVVEAYEELLATITTDQFDEAATAVFEEHKHQVYRYTRDLITDLKQKGYLLFAISGSQTEIVSKMAGYYGFDDFIGTDFERAGGHFTGNRTKYIGKKHEVIEKMATKHNAKFSGSIAVGDSAGDISMLAAVEQPIAFNPEKRLFDEAVKQGWSIVLERKNVVYELRADGDSYRLIL